jgi:PPOX class probable F420-dependent enzyme
MTVATLPDKFRDLVSSKLTFANLATVMPDGSPQVTPVWFDTHGEHIRVNTARGRQKDKNMTKNARVALAIVDPENPYRYLQIRGRVVSIEETGADEHIDSLAKKYLGKDKYPFRQPGEVRVIYEIEPTSFQSMG